MAEAIRIQTTRRDHLIAALAALAIVIQLAESALPSPLPGVKPGLANGVILFVLLRFGWSACAQVALLRVLGASLLLGSFGSPGFALSLAGTLASVAVLAGVRYVPATGPVGFSVLSALAHIGAQFALAWFWLIPSPALLTLLPVLLGASLVFGIVNGLIVAHLIKRRPLEHLWSRE